MEVMRTMRSKWRRSARAGIGAVLVAFGAAPALSLGADAGLGAAGSRFLVAFETGARPVLLKCDAYMPVLMPELFAQWQASGQREADFGARVYHSYRRKYEGLFTFVQEGIGHGTFMAIPRADAPADWRTLYRLVKVDDHGVASTCFVDYGAPDRVEDRPCSEDVPVKVVGSAGGAVFVRDVIGEDGRGPVDWKKYFHDGETFRDPSVRLMWLTTWEDLSSRWSETLRNRGGNAIVRAEMGLLAEGGRYGGPGGDVWLGRVTDFYCGKGLAPTLRIVNESGGDRIFRVAWRAAGGRPAGEPSQEIVEKDGYRDFPSPYGRDDIRGGGALEAVVHAFRPDCQTRPVSERTIAIDGPYADDEEARFTAAGEKALLEEGAPVVFKQVSAGETNLLAFSIQKNYAVIGGDADAYANAADLLDGYELSRDGRIPVRVRLSGGEKASAQLKEFAIAFITNYVAREDAYDREQGTNVILKVKPEEGRLIKVAQTDITFGSWAEVRAFLDNGPFAEKKAQLLDELVVLIPAWKVKLEAEKKAGETKAAKEKAEADARAKAAKEKAEADARAKAATTFQSSAQKALVPLENLPGKIESSNDPESYVAMITTAKKGLDDAWGKAREAGVTNGALYAVKFDTYTALSNKVAAAISDRKKILAAAAQSARKAAEEKAANTVRERKTAITDAFRNADVEKAFALLADWPAIDGKIAGADYFERVSNVCARVRAAEQRIRGEIAQLDIKDLREAIRSAQGKVDLECERLNKEEMLANTRFVNVWGPKMKGEIKSAVRALGDNEEKAQATPLPERQALEDWKGRVCYKPVVSKWKNHHKQCFQKGSQSNPDNVPQTMLAHIKLCQDASCPCLEARKKYISGDGKDETAFRMAALWHLLKGDDLATEEKNLKTLAKYWREEEGDGGK